MQPTRFVTIDPGIKGGLVYVDTAALTIKTWKMPTEPVGASGKPQVSPEGLLCLFKQMPATPQIWGLENVHSMERDGVVSAFTFGEGKGMLKMWIATLGGKLTLVNPATWKRDMGLLKNKNIESKYGQKKDAKLRAEQLARTIFKTSAGLLTTEGICEAALIMVWVHANLRVQVDYSKLK